MTAGLSLDERLEEGRALFNAGRFFEAHEKWEEVWLEETGSAKLLLQGLIQIAAGFHKARSGNGGAAVRLCGAGASKVRRAGAAGALAAFAEDVRRLTLEPRGFAPGAAPWPLLPPFGGVK